MAGYRLTGKASADLDGLYEYGIVHYGLVAANEYYDGLIERLEEIGRAPERYRSVDYIRVGCRMSVYGVNSIYYKIEDEQVVIVRVLGRQSLDNI